MFLSSYVLLWCLVIVNSIGLFVLFHHFGAIYLNGRDNIEHQGPKHGSLVRTQEVLSVDGRRVLVPRPSTPTLLLFMGLSCQVCARLKPELDAATGMYAEASVVVICEGDQAAVHKWREDLPARFDIVADPAGNTTRSFGVDVTPVGVAIDQNGRALGGGVVGSRDGLVSFVRGMQETISRSRHSEHRQDTFSTTLHERQIE